MSRVDLIAQMAVLKKAFLDKGESMDKLCGHFQAALDEREVVWLEESDRVVALCDYSWISSASDIDRVHKGERTEGPALYVINLICPNPKDIWKIRRQLPIHQYIVGLHDGKLHAPKGLPAYFLKKEVI